jgi:hypothetical protein
MRIVWKDSRTQKEYKPIRYRGYMIWGSSAGWEITVPGDHNVYANHYSAQNAIDQYFGDFGQHGTEKRKKYGIQIKKDSGTA